MPTEARVERNVSRVVIGFAIVLAGILFTLDNLHIVEAEHYVSYWPVFLVLIGVAQLVQSRTWSGYIWGLVLMFAGFWVLGENLGIVSVDIWTLSPLLLVLLGVSIIWRGFGPSVAPRGAAIDGTSFIRGTAVMGAFDRKSEAADFRGADLVAIMGGCKLDLRQATIAGEEVAIDVLAVMGGIELLVPDTWWVDSRVLPLMGGVGDRTRRGPTTPASQRLIVRGTVFMGGVDIKN
jgi:predicted membrane protein